MIIAAVLLTDRKPAFPVALEYLVNEPLIDKIYVNIEGQYQSDYNNVIKFLEESGKLFDVDYWWMDSSWVNKPKFDQDNARFMPIATGRNMALDWAIVQNMMQPVSHILFVDSDVRPHVGGLQHLLDLNKPLSGGVVPGRGVHSDAKYIFVENNDLQKSYIEPHIIKAIHGTSGYLLITKEIFEVQRFRVGPVVFKREIFVCDDPAYSSDALAHGLADAWYIDDRATADHVDDPDAPLTWQNAINGYTVGGSSA